MSQPGAIDGLQFARSESTLQGQLVLSQLPRLVESHCATEGVDFTLRGTIDPEGRARLIISVRGTLQLICQRCFGPVGYPLVVDSNLLLAGSMREIGEAEDEQDRVLAGKAMEVSGLIEDEILLNLPMVPRHEHCGEVEVKATEQRPSLFAVLKKLKG